MKKRTFLKTSSALVAGSMLSPLVSCGPGAEKSAESAAARTNWAGNLTYSTEIFHEAEKFSKSSGPVISCGYRARAITSMTLPTARPISYRCGRELH